jgi:ferrochelatase
MNERKAVLLVNLGSPQAPTAAAVRPYLREFLSDPRVLDLPWLLRQLLVHLVIVPRRAPQTAAAYAKIWTHQGSPLVTITDRVRQSLAKRVRMPVLIAMRYGKPSLEQAFRRLVDLNCDHLLVMPLYPHHAMSSTETVVARVRQLAAQLKRELRCSFWPAFYEDSDYIEALRVQLVPYLQHSHEHVLFSYHGLPERHIRKTDPTGSYCQLGDCCDQPHPVHAFCYRAQVRATSRATAAAAGIPGERYSVAFQSRLGRSPWLRPFTDEKLEQLPREGVKKLIVLCPSFVADCLETLEEMGLRGRQLFLDAGGEQFHLVPCLNDQPRWIETLQRWVESPWPATEVAARNRHEPV